MGLYKTAPFDKCCFKGDAVACKITEKIPSAWEDV